MPVPSSMEFSNKTQEGFIPHFGGSIWDLGSIWDPAAPRFLRRRIAERRHDASPPLHKMRDQEYKKAAKQDQEHYC